MKNSVFYIVEERKTKTKRWERKSKAGVCGFVLNVSKKFELKNVNKWIEIILILGIWKREKDFRGFYKVEDGESEEGKETIGQTKYA